MQVDIAGKGRLDENCRKVSISGRRRKPQVIIRWLSMCTVENFKNHPGLHRVRVCHWSAVDVFCSWFLWKGARARHKSGTRCLWLSISIYCIAVLNFKTFFFREEGVNWAICRLYVEFYRCFQVSRYQVSWYVNQPRGLTAWCANIPLSVV